jgi:Fe-S-cluster containining protein
MIKNGAAQTFAIEAVRATLGTCSDADGCVALAARINALMDQALASFRGDGIACREGCNFCCHLRVMVFPHEAIALFRYLDRYIPSEQADGIRARLLENAERRARLTREGQLVPATRCAFLVDGKCSAYEVRPAACSAYHSLSKGRCEDGYYKEPGAVHRIPVLQALRFVSAALDEGMDEGLAAAGLNGTHVELHTALAALMRAPGLIETWRSGRELSDADAAKDTGPVKDADAVKEVSPRTAQMP